MIIESFARWHSKVLELAGDLQLPKLAARNRFAVGESCDGLTYRKGLRVGAYKRDDYGG